jgi:hypothetical protein
LSLDNIVEELKKERGQLDRAIAALEESASPRVTRKTHADAQQPAVVRRKKHGGITPEGRKRLSVAMKRRWAERRKKGS